MIEAIGNAFTGVIGWVGEFVTALTGAEGALKDLLPVFVIGIGVSLLLFFVHLIYIFLIFSWYHILLLRLEPGSLTGGLPESWH